MRRWRGERDQPEGGAAVSRRRRQARRSGEPCCRAGEWVDEHRDRRDEQPGGARKSEDDQAEPAITGLIGGSLGCGDLDQRIEVRELVDLEVRATTASLAPFEPGAELGSGESAWRSRK